MVKHLSQFVLVKLQPMTVRKDLNYARRFGMEQYPAVLLLDWRARRKLGEIGDVPAEELAAKAHRLGAPLAVVQEALCASATAGLRPIIRS